ncbi:DUF2336 domain-containing protein [Bradyrhizobium neotropicale]|uniref:DUF2336 domain-containing protein n=1 Tax=Bradyrhizobium neotropicale TaxID=1497615 RepID=A0A176ZDE1_9BRAD|nr:DUF2336 domain-containing protein [Bradyrhizobium neotropicale]OAF18437.1 hypothetical protein AXW67_04780 [Bradyrhizobium neotropicale]
MTAISPVQILAELEQAVAICPPERCARILSGIVRLLSASGNRPQELLVNVVDGILLRLTERVTPNTLFQLSITLSELTVAPKETLQRLALHEDPAVADPVLRGSQALSPTDLEVVAMSRGDPHLLAISARDRIEPALAGMVVKRGSSAVCLALIKNPGARFSDAAYATLIERSEQDGEIAKALALRPDTPDMVVRKLLRPSPRQAPAAKTNESCVPPEQGTYSSPKPAPIASKRPCAADYERARPEIVALNRVGKLSDSTVNRFAMRGEIANLLMALSVLSGAPIEIIEHIMTDPDCEALVMACRASRLNWQTTLAILSNRSGGRLSFAERERAQKIFEALLLSTSQWTVRWGELAANADIGGPGHRSARTGVHR